MPSPDQLDNLQRIQQESEQQSLPQQEKVFAVAKRVLDFPAPWRSEREPTQ